MPYQIVWVEPDPEEDDENVGMEYRCEADGVILAIYSDSDPSSQDPATVTITEVHLERGDLVQLYRDDVLTDDPMDALLKAAQKRSPGEA